MAIRRYCWRNQTVVPMLEPEEWKLMHPVLKDTTEEIKNIRREKGISLKEALPIAGESARALYEKLTGYKERDFNIIWYYENAQYGPDCPMCGKPYRTPKAKLCVECGHKRQ